MIKVLSFSILFGISMLLINPKDVKPATKLIDSLNAIVLKMVNIIMKMAPFAVFALLSQIIVSDK